MKKDLMEEYYPNLKDKSYNDNEKKERKEKKEKNKDDYYKNNGTDGKNQTKDYNNSRMKK